MEAFIGSIEACIDTLHEWNENIWNLMVESGTVYKDGSITFKFKNGTEITV